MNSSNPSKNASGRRPRLRTETGRRRRAANSSSSGRIAAVDARARAIDDRFAKLERRMTAVIDALDALESRVGGLRRSTDERLTAIERRLDAVERARPKSARHVDPDRLAERVAAQAIQPVLKAIDQRLAKLGEREQASRANASDYNHKHFVALAREVRGVRKQLDEPGREVVTLVNTPNFKALLDNKLKAVITYLAEDVIPKVADGAVLRALAAQGE